MTPTHTPPVFKPRLLAITKGTERQGYLLLSAESAPKKIGTTASPEYKLVQSLFNPANEQQIRFHPVAQTHERVYAKITGVNYSYVTQRIQDGIQAQINQLLTTISKSDAGKHINFTQTTRSIMMSISPTPVALV